MVALAALPQGRPRLLSHQAYQDRQVAVRDGETWLGLFHAASGWEVAATTLHIGPAPNACGNEHRVTLDRAGTPMFLGAGIPALREGPVPSVLDSALVMQPGMSRDFRIGENTFRLRATNRPRNDLHDYVLELVSLDDHRVTALVSFHAGTTMDPAAKPAQVLWAGDLDHDGMLDVYADINLFEHPGHWVLFLSSAARSGQVVGKAAELQGMDC